MSALPKLRVIESAEPAEVVFDVEEGYPLVPDATYTAICCGVEVKPTFKTLKAYVRFRIADGEHAGKVLFRPYNIGGHVVPGRGPGSGPRPKLARRHHLFLMLCRVLNLPANTKPHRVSSKELIGKLCRIKTRTVTHDHRQKEMPLAARYSVVDDVLSVETC